MDNGSNPSAGRIAASKARERHGQDSRQKATSLVQRVARIRRVARASRYLRRLTLHCTQSCSVNTWAAGPTVSHGIAVQNPPGAKGEGQRQNIQLFLVNQAQKFSGLIGQARLAISDGPPRRHGSTRGRVTDSSDASRASRRQVRTERKAMGHTYRTSQPQPPFFPRGLVGAGITG